MKDKYNGFVGLSVVTVLFLAMITIIGLDPAKNFASARDVQREEDVTTILNAINQYVAADGNYDLGTDNDYDMVPNCFETPIEIGIGEGYYDLNQDNRMVPTYLVAMPFDPQIGTREATGYTLCHDYITGRYTISAPYTEKGVAISVTR